MSKDYWEGSLIFEKLDFYFPVFKVKVSEHNALKDLTLRLLETADAEAVHSNTDNISKTDYHIKQGERKPYCDFLLPKLNPYFKLFYDDMRLSQYGYYHTFHTIWFQQYHNNDTHDWHNHGDCCWSSVYYLELPKDGPTTEFMDPSGNIMTADANEGDLLIFDNMALHRSPPNLSKDRKTIVSMNIH